MTSSPEPMPRSVLIVDESDDSREVLRTILSQRGIQIFEAREQQAGLQIAKAQHPDVLVLDVDTPTGDLVHYDEIAEQAEIDRTSVVLLGKIPQWNGRSPREIVRKPYHYGPLIRKIETLLAEPSVSQKDWKAA